MSEREIQRILENYYNRAKFCVNNIYFFRRKWETDLLVVKRNGYMYDIEIKRSKDDFFADFKKKDKHSAYEKGWIRAKKTMWAKKLRGKGKKRVKKGDKMKVNRPNRFYYAVPSGIIKKSNIPDYAGYLRITKSGVTKVKKAPMLHKGKNSQKPLMMKFYWRWRNARN